jgi:fucose permease
LVLLFAVLALFPSYPRVSTGYRFSQAVRLLGEKPVLVAAFALLCYIALEISMNTWIKPLMTEMSGGSQNPEAAKHATWVLSLFGLSMATGRFATSTIKGLTAVGTKLIAGASLVTVGAIALMAFTHSYSLAVMAVIAVGLALAPIFPTIVGVTFSRYEPSLYGSIFGIMFAIGLLGPTIVPKVIGSLSVGASIQKSLPIAAVMALVLCALAVLMGKLAPRKQVIGPRPGLEENAAPGTANRTSN